MAGGKRKRTAEQDGGHLPGIAQQNHAKPIASFTTLPVEVMSNVLQFLGTPDLAACCRVSKATAIVAEYHLHRRITIHPGERNPAGQLVARKHLLDRLESLTIEPHDSTIRGQHLDDIANLVEETIVSRKRTGLRELHVYGGWGSHEDRLLVQPNRDQGRAFELLMGFMVKCRDRNPLLKSCTWAESLPHYWTMNELTIFSHPDLTSLKIGRARFSKRSDATAGFTLAPKSTALQNLELDGCYVLGADTVLKQILSCPQDLKRLVLRIEVSAEDAALLDDMEWFSTGGINANTTAMLAQGRSLQELVLDYSDLWTYSGIEPIETILEPQFRQFTQLRILDIDTESLFGMSKYFEDFPWHNLPPMLQCLVVYPELSTLKNVILDNNRFTSFLKELALLFMLKIHGTVGAMPPLTTVVLKETWKHLTQNCDGYVEAWPPKVLSQVGIMGLEVKREARFLCEKSRAHRRGIDYVNYTGAEQSFSSAREAFHDHLKPGQSCPSLEQADLDPRIVAPDSGEFWQDRGSLY